MKKHLSVFGLLARGSVYKILLVLLIMSLSQIGLFVYNFKKGNSTSIEYLVDDSRFILIFFIAFVLITVFLCRTGSEYGSKCGYTLNRLSVSEQQIFLHQAVFNCLMYLLLLATQVALAFGVSAYYMANMPASSVSEQTVFLAFWRNDLLHSILPLSDFVYWIRNVIIVAVMGAVTAEFPYKQRRGRFSVTTAVFSVFVTLFFVRGIGDIFSLFLTVVVSIVAVGEILFFLFDKEVESGE